jgi:hypothetical protein
VLSTAFFFPTADLAQNQASARKETGAIPEQEWRPFEFTRLIES